MWDLDRKETESQRIVAFELWLLEKTLEYLLDRKVKSVNPKGNQLWIVIGRTDAEAEAPVPWPSDVNRRLTGKDSDAGKDWGQEEKGAAEDEMGGWHHWLNGLELEQAPEGGEGQEAWCAVVQGTAKSLTGPRDWRTTAIPPSPPPPLAVGVLSSFLSLCVCFVSNNYLFWYEINVEVMCHSSFNQVQRKILVITLNKTLNQIQCVRLKFVITI